MLSTALSDPYVIVQLGASGAETPQVWRTSVKSNTLNPVYNEVRAPAPALSPRSTPRAHR